MTQAIELKQTIYNWKKGEWSKSYLGDGKQE